jgi:hypothetical protein
MAGQVIRYQTAGSDQAAPAVQKFIQIASSESLYTEPRIVYDMYIELLKRDPLIFFVMMCVTLALLAVGMRLMRQLYRQ